MSMPEGFKHPIPIDTLPLVITKADGQGITYSVLQGWAPWRMPHGLVTKGEFTTIPTTP
ncbi:hypothetical protein [Azospirillum sp. B4]|nr:hypothetical protein [Azospirillum sp. B4]